MEKYFKKILSLLAVFAMVISVFPVSARADYASSTDSFWSRYIRMGVDSVHDVPLIGTMLGYLTASGSAVVCGKSDDQLHHADSFQECRVGKDGRPYVLCVCKYCGDLFEAYASDLDTAYKKYVQTLPANNINSAGLSDFYITGWTYKFPSSDISEIVYQRSDALSFELVSGSSTSGYLYVGACSGFFTVPADGTYRIVVPRVSYSARYSVGKLGLLLFRDNAYSRVPFSAVYESSTPTVHRSTLYVGTSEDYYADVSLSKNVTYCLSTVSNSSSFVPADSVLAFAPSTPYQTLNLFTAPYIQGIDLASNSPSAYSPETRPGSLVGLYGDVNGSAFSDNEITLVDESGKTIYNPVTGETYNFTDWTYDYSTRTYTITTDNSQTVTVNYGDEYVTIKEGDTIYNVYYIVQGGGGTPVDPDTCQHTYTSTTDREPTCTVPGSKTLTCSKCGNVTTESIPAKGHTWTILQTVQTSYDENGELVQQGYTIYQCSVCGEQYKDINGAGPPDGGGEEGKKSIWEKIGDLISSVADGFITIIETALGKILDYLIALVEAINAKLESVVNAIFGLFDRIPQLFGGFTDFLVAVFPFMPQEFFDILIFTLLVICAAAIIRFLWKR